MNSMIKIGLALAIISLAGCLPSRKSAEKGTDIPDLIKAGALVIDTRTEGEYADGHIDGAINIPYDVIGNVIGQYQTDKSKPIIVYCRSGRRSGIAKQTLESAGYTSVTNGGGLQQMREALQQ